MNILIVDGEKLIVKGLKHSLEQNDFCVYTAFDGKEALDMVSCNQLDFILLDIMLPKIDGVTLCKKIREKHDVPIIMLTTKKDYIDKLLRLEFGADDYVTKPFNTRELIARINEVYRRYINKHDNEEIMQHGSLKINISSCTAFIDDIEIVLTTKEFDLLKTFIKSPGRVFTRENLFDIVWNESIFDTRTVDVHIKSLREKIEEDSSKPQLIKTKWGVGYYLKRG
ncbi:MAG: response regulator transcription factor [Lutisporaceae bacterium]